ncbi:MAG: site-specific DNA-methyltransferase [Ruminococcus sp.]|nr:site-specific DNA-methyltransferase [Ruminococcus sp.]
MIKDIIESNETVSPNDREIAILRENFPSCFKSDGSFDIERFKEFLSDKVAVTHEGYELKFLGKNYARLLAAEDTTTVISPDVEHNSRPENENSENIYISADNLDALKHLLKSYAGRVKCIYIDPPYNTGSDGFVYNDSFNFTAEELSVRLSIDLEQAERILDLTKRGSASHSAWLMFMYPRLLLARDLLDKDGIILISVDDNEQANVQLLCNDVFGEENHLVTMARRTKSGGGSAADAFAIEHDYICVYSRDAKKTGKLFMPFSEDYLKRYSEEDDNGKYFWDTMERSSTATRPYVITAPDGTQLTGKWFRSEERFIEDLKCGEVRFLHKDDGTWSVQFKQRLAPGKKMRSLLYENEFKSYSDDLDELGLKDTFSYPKTVFLIQYLLQLIESGSLIVDFFSGSATTAHAIMKDNIRRICNGENDGLKYIMVQLPEDLDYTVKTTNGDSLKIAKTAISILDSVSRPHTLDQIGIERIIRAAAKIREEHPETTADLGFKHYTLYEPSTETLDKLESFSPDQMFSNLLDEFGVPTVLTTWLVRDGYGFTAKYETLDFAGYEAYFCGKHLYLINEGLSDEAITAICEKLESDANFNPENIILFGYSFTWGMRDTLQINVKRLKDTEKNLRVNFDVRY